MPQLDGLRAVAIAAVLWQHGFPDGTAWVHALPWGTAGVRLFFVLSGFLITGILLECRDLADRGEVGTGHVLRRFYARRALRILPIYYGVLIVAAVFDLGPVREIWVWLATFTTNLYLAWQGDWLWGGFVNHLWTLAVEEQFYLLWPWVVIFVPRRRIDPVLLCAVASALLWRIASVALGHPALTTELFSLSAFDSLALGSLLASARRGGLGGAEGLRRLRAICLRCGGPLLALLMGLELASAAPGVRLVLVDFAMALFFTWLVDRAADGFGGATGRFLSWAPVRYLGQISYGVYVVHLFVRGTLATLVMQGLLPPPANLGVRCLEIVGLSIAVGALSWHFFERPINDLKRRFPYGPDARSEVAHRGS